MGDLGSQLFIMHFWIGRNEQHGKTLIVEFERGRIIHDLATSLKVARWAYSQIAGAGGLTWSENEKLVPLEPGWDQIFTAVRKE